MIPGLTSIIIPTRNHARVLPDAVRSALTQTMPVEVIVVDDGSTDDTWASIPSFFGGDPGWRAYRIEHAGPSAARNRGLDEARGEFVMFLDADDLIDRTKVARQLAAMTPEAGWVLCDVEIITAPPGPPTLLASKKYGYAKARPSGWLAPRLEARNFIPIMSPLVRMSVIGGQRFEDRELEDWQFWKALAVKARAAYVPEVLATYRRSHTGRNHRRAAAKGVLFSPHNDDETLFAAYLIAQHHPHVVVCCPSSGDYGASSVREAESRRAMAHLGAGGFEQWPGDFMARMRALDVTDRPARVWAPHPTASHPEHVAVACAAREVFGDRVTTYHTYDAAGKVRGALVQPEPAWVLAKLRALACYESQIAHPRARAFFTADLAEYR